MNVWFESAQALFEVFLEEKLGIFGAAVASCGESSAPVELTMRALPSEFIDDIHQQMERIYIDLPSGFDATDCGESADFLYGELTPLGVRQLAGILAPFADGGKFVDFGCGTGKVVFELSLLFNSMQCIGVELSAERAMIGKIAAGQKMSGSNNLEIVCDSFFEFPPATAQVSVAFCCGLGFDTAMTTKVLDRIHMFPGLRLCVLLLRQDPRNYCSHPLFEKAATIDFKAVLCTSWMNEAPATVLMF